MRKYLLPSALILAFGIALAGAQVITKSIQLTQDPRSPIGMDASNNVYFPAHVLSVGPNTAPVLTACGGGTPTITGTDTAGVITEGTSSAGCTVTFNRAFLAAPYCNANAAAASAMGVSTTTTTMVLAHASASSGVINYICIGLK